MECENIDSKNKIEMSVEDIANLNYKIIVISGMPKTGTTLPLTLLDSHPDLIVYPEELRFFHLYCDVKNGNIAAKKFLENSNTQILKSKKSYYDSNDYMAHGGTGFGVRDYSVFEFDKFEIIIKNNFSKYENPRYRFLSIIYAYVRACGKDELKEGFIFVCKAPHNELYAEKWDKILGDKGKYIICTRNPLEHYLSLKNVGKLANKKAWSAIEYSFQFYRRRCLWDVFPEKQRYFLDYDELINNSEQEMRKISDFIGIIFSSILLVPTKFGVSWSGNSSRGIVEKKIFNNKHQARNKLSTKDVCRIEKMLKSYFLEMNWEVVSKKNIFNDVFTKFIFFVYDVKTSFKNILKEFLHTRFNL